MSDDIESLAFSMFVFDQARINPSGFRATWEGTSIGTRVRYREVAAFIVSSPTFQDRILPQDATMTWVYTHANGVLCTGDPCSTPPTYQHRVWREPDRPYVPVAEPDTRSVSS